MARWYVALAALVGISGCYSAFQALEERDGGVDASAPDAGREPDPSCASGIEWLDHAPVTITTGSSFFSVVGGERFWIAYPGDAAPGCPASGPCWRVAPIETSGGVPSPRIVSWSWNAGLVEIRIDPDRRPFFVSLGAQRLQWASAPPAEGEWPREGAVEIDGDDRFLATATLSNDGRRIFAVTQRRAAYGFWDELRVIEADRATGVVIDHDLRSAVPGGLFDHSRSAVVPGGDRVWVGYRHESDGIGAVGLVALDGSTSQHAVCDVSAFEIAPLSAEHVVIAEACDDWSLALEIRGVGSTTIPTTELLDPHRAPGLALRGSQVAVSWVSDVGPVVAIYGSDLREITRGTPPGEVPGLTRETATSLAVADDGTFMLARGGGSGDPGAYQRFRACH